jgi:hypothetical protein
MKTKASVYVAGTLTGDWIGCCRQGPGSPAASARIHPVLRRSSPSSPSTNRPAFKAARSCANNGRIRFFTSRSYLPRLL